MSKVKEIQIDNEELQTSSKLIIQPKKAKIVIVGAGINGLALAILLAKKNYEVVVFEKRNALEEFQPSFGRAMNLTLCERGLRTFDEIQLRHTILEKSVCLIGREVHKEIETEFQPYGIKSNETLYGIRRYDLSAILFDMASQFSNISIKLGKTCLSINKEKKTALLEDSVSENLTEESYDLLVGADGIFSEVRKLMQRNEPSQNTEQVSAWGYKELTIPHNNNFSLDKLHVWPRKNALIVGIPNLDKSITCSLFYSTEKTTAGINEIQFRTLFSTLIRSVPELITQFNSNPVNSLHTIETSPWVFKDSIVLVGDSCHGTLPFLGQGLNSGLEDCLALVKAIERSKDDWTTSLHKYNFDRKKNADALVLLIDRHLTFLKTGHKSLKERLSEKLFCLFSKAIPGLGQPIYSLISHTTVSYDNILRCAKLRDKYSIVIPTVFFILCAFVYFSLTSAGAY